MYIDEGAQGEARRGKLRRGEARTRGPTPWQKPTIIGTGPGQKQAISKCGA